MIGPTAMGSNLILPNLTVNLTVLGLTVAALWGVSDFLGGLASRRAPAVLVVAIAHTLSVVLLVVSAAATHANFPSERTAVWGLITGLSGGGAVIVFYQALALGEMGLAAALAGLLSAAAPVVFSWVAEGRPKTTQIIGFVIAAVAIFLIAYEPHGRPHPKGLALAALAGLGFGVFLITSKFASQGAIEWPLAYSRMASASLAAALLLVMRVRQGKHLRGNEASRPKRSSRYVLLVLLLAGSAGILEAVGNLIYMLATLEGRLDVAAVLSSLYPAGPILLGMWLLKERVTRGKALGMALALTAVVLISL